LEVVAHIGGIPVEETLPFLVPVVLLYVWARRASRKRNAALERLPGQPSSLSDAAIQRVLDTWSKTGHELLAREHVPLFYPPGIDGASREEIAARIGAEPSVVDSRLDTLADLGYIDLDDGQGHERRAWLTGDGYLLVHAMEDALLEEHKQHSSTD
jgi:hypothetical protein